MGMGFAGQAGKVFGYDDAYGGSGMQAAIGDLQNAIRDESWANNASNEAWRQISNRNPFGYGAGAALDGQSTVRQFGDPRAITGIAGNAGFSPVVMAPKLPPSMMPGLGLGPGRSGAHVPTNAETLRGMQRDRDYWSDMLGGYQAVSGNRWTVPNEVKRNWSATLPAYPALMGIADAPAMQRGSLSPSRDVFSDQFTPAPSRGNSTTWPYGMRTQSSSFDRFPTDPITAGAVHARMTYGGARAQGGRAERNTLYKVLEGGDEMFVPDTGGRIVPLPAHAAGGFGGGGSPRVTVHPAPGVQTEVRENGRDVTIFQRASMANDLTSGTSARQLQAAYGFKRSTTRRG
jgi:hypothetical protein